MTFDGSAVAASTPVGAPRVDRRRSVDVLAVIVALLLSAGLLIARSHLATTRGGGALSTAVTSTGLNTVSAHSTLNQPVVGGTNSPSGNGAWMVAADGGIFTSGDAAFFGSTGGVRLNRPIIGMAATPTGRGYWLVASDGGIFSFGDASFYGSTGGIPLNRPIVAIAPTPTGRGYWLVASDGGVFSFGDAAFHGSTGSVVLNQPIVAAVATPTGRGYWFVAADGGLFNFGDAVFAGSAAGRFSDRTVGLAAARGHGYWIAAANGQTASLGGAPDVGSAAGMTSAPFVGAAAFPADRGVRLFAADGSSTGLSPSGPSSYGVPTAPAGGSVSYSYMVTNANGTPGRWDPCTPIHYVTNLSEAPAGSASLVSHALAQVAAATGDTFINDGPTTEIPSNGRPSYQPDRYGQRWAPVVIAWAQSSQTNQLPGGNVVGEGGPTWMTAPNGDKVFVTGEVLIDRNATQSLSVGFAGSSLGELLLHELGHVMGLGHTGDATQIMYPTLTPLPQASYGAGDRTGLSAVGRSAGCLTTPAP